MHQVLVVEDDPLMGDSLTKRLREEGFQVHWAEDGYTAIKQLRAQRYDAVVLDLIIHGALNGFGVLNFIELEQPRVTDRVFLVTGMPEQTVIRMAPRLLPRYYRKPFDQERLIADIVAVVRPPPAMERPEVGPRALVVDDDETSAALLAMLIRQMGYVAETAASGREAIAKLSERNFDTVVLDLVMPEIDGFSVLEFLRSCRPEVIGCTIVLSALPERYRHGLEQYEVLAALEKPVDTSRLRDLLRECLKN